MHKIALAGLAFGALAALPLSATAQDAPDPTAAIAGEYKTDSGHAYITFHYDHQGYSRPYVRWRDWSGTLNWTPENPSESAVDVTIDVASVDSGVDRFDDHLKAEDFFNAEEFPTITFKSTSIETTGPNTGTITGDLTIKGVTKPVTLDATLNRAANDDFAKAYKLGFSATGTVLRSDFGVDKYAPFVSDEVKLVIETEWVKDRGEE